MQKQQKTQSHPLSARSSSIVSKVGGANYPFATVPFTSTGSPDTIGITSAVVSGSFSPYSDLSISHIAITPSMLAGYILPQFGNQLATMLARVLDELEKNNKEAIGPIVSILEPYIEVNRSLKVNILPKSSREVNIEITKVGRATPIIHLDESST